MTSATTLKGPFSPGDKAAALMRIGEENARRAAAELDPLPTGTAAEILSGYQAFWDALIASSHADYV